MDLEDLQPAGRGGAVLPRLRGLLRALRHLGLRLRRTHHACVYLGKRGALLAPVVRSAAAAQSACLMDPGAEIVDVVDEDDNVVGYAARAEVRARKLLHLSLIHI